MTLSSMTDNATVPLMDTSDNTPQQFDRGGELEQWARSREATRQITRREDDDE